MCTRCVPANTWRHWFPTRTYAGAQPTFVACSARSVPGQPRTSLAVRGAIDLVALEELSIPARQMGLESATDVPVLTDT
jgi:hypothetical protein